jgi:hypothetical protein
MATVEEAERRVKEAEQALAIAQAEAKAATLAFRKEKPITAFILEELEKSNDAGYDGASNDYGAGDRLYGLLIGLVACDRIDLWNEGTRFALPKFAVPMDRNRLTDKCNDLVVRALNRLEGK